MQMDKKLIRNIFYGAAGCVILAWLLRDTERFRALVGAFWSLIAPFVVGAALAFIFNVPMRAIERQLDGVRHKGFRRGLSIVLTVLFLILIIMFVVELLVPQIRQTVDSLTASVPAFVERVAATLRVYMDENPDIKQWVLDALDMETINWNTLLKNGIQMAADAASSVMGSAFSVIGNVAGTLVNVVISIVFCLYCLARKDILACQGKKILYSLLPEKTTDEILRILRLTNTTFSSFISGQCLEACILGCLFAVSMALFRMPYIPLVSVIIAVTALVPVVGAFVGCIVGAFFILVEDPVQALTFVVMFLVLQQIEGNLIYPRVVGTSVGLPGMWVLVAVSIGGELLGVGGMLLMIPLTSVLYTLLREFTDRRLEERHIPAEKLRSPPPEIQPWQQKKQAKKDRAHLEKMKEQLRKLQQK